MKLGIVVGSLNRRHIINARLRNSSGGGGGRDLTEGVNKNSIEEGPTRVVRETDLAMRRGDITSVQQERILISSHIYVI